MLQKRIADIITSLKKVREENGLSYQRIVDLVEENGDYVSISTVRRVFEEGSEAYGFQYENTLKPIAAAVLGLYGSSEDVTPDEADTMKAIIDYKSERIADLQERLKRAEESYKRRIEFLKSQIALKDERIDRRDALIEKMLDRLLRTEGDMPNAESKEIAVR